MANTTANDIIESFESSFADKSVIPKELEIVWLKKAVGRFSLELDSLNFNDTTLMFDKALPQYVIDTLAEFMKQSYQERYLSLVNKRVSIVSKDISWDGSNGSKTAAKQELEYIAQKAAYLVEHQKPSAYTN